jgi:hypothetical protein
MTKMSDVMETAPVTTTETAPVETTQQTQQQAAPQAVQPATETKSSLLDVFKSKAPQGAPTGWLEKVKDEDALIKTVYAAQSLIGKKGDIPAEDAPEEVRGAFWKKMGADEIKGVELVGQQKELFEESVNKLADIYKSTLLTAKNSKDHAQKMLSAYVQAEEQAMIAEQNAAKAAEAAELQALSRKFGLNAEQITAEINGVYSRFGWSADTPIREALLTIAKETGNSRVMVDANLHNTIQGLETQQKHAYDIVVELAKNPNRTTEYDAALKELKAINAKVTAFSKNSG